MKMDLPQTNKVLPNLKNEDNINILMLDDVDDSFFVLGRKFVSSLKRHNSPLSHTEELSPQPDHVEQIPELSTILSNSSNPKWQYLKSEVTKQYINEVKNTVANCPEIFNEFLSIITAFDKKYIDEYEFVQLMTYTLKDYHQLLYRLNMILPSGRIVTIMPDENGYLSHVTYRTSERCYGADKTVMRDIFVTDRATSITLDPSKEIKLEDLKCQNEISASSSPLPADKVCINSLCKNQPINSNLEQMRKQNDLEKELKNLLEENARLKKAIEQNTVFMKQQLDKTVKWQTEVTEICNDQKKKYREAKDLISQLQQENDSLRKSGLSETKKDRLSVRDRLSVEDRLSVRDRLSVTSSKPELYVYNTFTHIPRMCETEESKVKMSKTAMGRARPKYYIQ